MSTRTEAERLGIRGYAINLENGDVEVLACGEQTALDSLERWLWSGPPAAQVSQVVGEDTAAAAPDSFSTA